MADVSHELGSIRHIVDTPLSSKVAMFNKVANQHNASQLLNPFANVDGRASPKPSFSKDEYGKPLAGSMTELRGQKANIHVCKEMLELCQIINSEGFQDEDNADLKIIFFGDLFNIYNYISDKVVGLLLRARKHKLVDFEGEMLFQRRDDEVPIFLVKPIKEIRSILEAKQEEFRRSVSPAPQPTTVLQDRLKRVISPRSAPTSKAASPQPEVKNISATSSVISLASDVKPPTGQTLHPAIIKSLERINDLIKPAENCTTQQKIISPSAINITKSTEKLNDVIKPLATPITISDAQKVASKEELIQITTPVNEPVTLSKSQISDAPLQEQVIQSKIIVQPNVENLKQELANGPKQLLNAQSESKMSVQSEPKMSSLSTIDSNSTIKSEQTNKIDQLENGKLEKISQSQIQSVPQSQCPPSNTVESNRSNSFVGEVAPQ